jgi:hypothetical protein
MKAQENNGKEIHLSLSMQFYSVMGLVELSVKEYTCNEQVRRL